MSNLIDILSRFYLRNISFLYTTNRIDEISYIQSIQPDMTPFIKSLPSKTCEQLDKVLNHNDSNFTEIRRKISETPSSEVLNKALKLIKK